MSHVELRGTGMDRQMQQMVASLPPEQQKAIAEAYREHRDNLGRKRGEVTTPPTAGSRKYRFHR